MRQIAGPLTAWLDTVGGDFIVALRTLRHNGRFVGLAVMTLGLGVALSVLLFSLYSAVVLNALDFRDARRLVLVQSATASGSPLGALSYPTVQMIGGADRVFERVGYYEGPQAVTLRTGSGAEILFGLRVSAGFFATFGTPPLLGRTFDVADTRAGGEDVVVLGYDLWQRSFGGDPGVVGRTVRLDATDTRIAGVMPRRFGFPTTYIQLWRPQVETAAALSDHQARTRSTIARLQPGVSMAAAQHALAPIAEALKDERPDVYRQPVFSVVSLRDHVVGPVGRMLAVVAGAVGCVMLVCCANLVNLLLLRHSARERIVAIRIALGASAGRIWQLLICESVVVGTLAAALGIGIALGAVRLVRVLGPRSIPRLRDMEIDLTVMGVAVALAVGAAALAALVPALRCHGPIAPNLGARGPRPQGGTPGGRFLLPHVFCLAQFAASVFLCIGAALLTLSLYRLERTPLGFTPSGLLNLQIMSLSGDHSVILGQLMTEIAALPGVRAVAAANIPPLTGVYFQRSVRVERRPGEWEGSEFVSVRTVSPDYFRTLEIPLLKGRPFSDRDRRAAPCVVIVSEAAARSFWPGRNPLGAGLDLDDSNRPYICRVVGVTGDARDRSVETAPVPQVYFSHLQQPDGVLTVLVRASGSPALLTKPILAQALRVTGGPQGASVWALEDLIAGALRAPRFRTVSLAFFAAAALVLAAMGIYAVTAHTVSVRARDIGIRLALGATPRRAMFGVCRGVVISILLGLGLSVPAALAVVYGFRSQLFEILQGDPLVFTLVPCALAAVALLAAYLPARRVARLDPRVVLYQD